MNPNEFELDDNLYFRDSLEEAIDGAEIARTDLREELMKNVVRLSCDSMAVAGLCHVYLLGTIHNSQGSCREVESIIRFLKPQVVFLELCSRRISVLSPSIAKEPTMVDMIDVWKRNQNLLESLVSFYIDKVASKLGVAQNSEFRVAYEEAKKYGGKVILGDRHIEITFVRTWGRMSVWYRAICVLCLLMYWTLTVTPTPEELNKMMGEFDDKDTVTLTTEELRKKLPTLVETLIDERDQYMSSKLLELAKEHSSIVAVVGKGDLEGIKQNWEQPIEIQKPLEVPSGVKMILEFLGIAVGTCRYMYSKLLELAKEHSSIVAVVGKGHLQGINRS